VVGQREALEAARALVQLDDTTYAAVTDLLEKAAKPCAEPAPDADADTERALILKGVAAHAQELLADSTNAQALSLLDSFATAIRGLPRPEVISHTTAADLDDLTNSSTFNPDDYTAGSDTRAQNDGMFQKYTTSCVPTVSEIVRAAEDPIFAFALNADGGVQSPSTASFAARLQKQVLEQNRFCDVSGKQTELTPGQEELFAKSGELPPGVYEVRGFAVPRFATRFLDTLANAVSEGAVSEADEMSLKQSLEGIATDPATTDGAQRALTFLRAANNGFPSDADLETLKGIPLVEGLGLNESYGLDEVASPATHLSYVPYRTPDATPSTDQLGMVEQLLAQGQAVPFDIGTDGVPGGHAMTFLDVRGKTPNRFFLVADPWSGRTEWVTESDLSTPHSNWLDRQFGVGWERIRDVFAQPGLTSRG
jgi:hypothetical protein